MNETKTLIVISTVLLTLGYVAMWYAGIFDGLGFHGTIAAVLGVILTTIVGVGLMALLFHSARTRHDQHAHKVWAKSAKKSGGRRHGAGG